MARFLGEPKRVAYAESGGPAKFEGAIFEIDEKTGACLSVEAVRATE